MTLGQQPALVDLTWLGVFLEAEQGNIFTDGFNQKVYSHMGQTPAASSVTAGTHTPMHTQSNSCIIES